MGYETNCLIETDGQRHEGRALLETDEIIVRGPLHLRIPLKTISAVAVSNGRLEVRHAGGSAVLHLGDQAARWAERIRSPKSRLEKMGISATTRVAVVGLDDAEFRAELEASGALVSYDRPPKDSRLIVFGAERIEDLERLSKLRTALAPDGVLWVVHRKGKEGVKDVEIFAAARTAGLTSTKVARFSETHTAEKLVIPLGSR